MANTKGTAWQDQERAAAADTARMMDKLHRHFRGLKGAAGWGEVGKAWRRQFVSHIEDGTLLMCIHMSGPVPSIINAWQLDRIRCVQCNQIAVLLGEVGGNDDQCDGCQRLFPGQITPALHKLGPMILIGGMCPDCYKLDRATGGKIT